MKRNRIVFLLMLVVGAILFLGGIVGFYSLYQNFKEYEHTTAVVLKLQTKKVYRQRKIRYDTDMLLRYPTTKYGELSVSMKSYNPFRHEGDELSLWYHPERPREVIQPLDESLVWGILLIAGLICISGGKIKRESA